MPVRVKFEVTRIEPVGGESGTHIYLLAVTEGSKENKSFFKYTPSGEISLLTINDEAAKEFGKVGDEFYVDFTKAE